MTATVSTASEIISAMVNSNVMDSHSGLPSDDLMVVRAHAASVHEHEVYASEKTTITSTPTSKTISSVNTCTTRDYHHQQHYIHTLTHQQQQQHHHHHHPHHHHHNQYHFAKDEVVSNIREEDEEVDFVDGDISDAASSISLGLKHSSSQAQKYFVEKNQRKVDSRQQNSKGRRTNSFHAHIPCGQVKTPNPQPHHFHHPIAHRQSFKSSFHPPSTSLPVHHVKSNEYYYSSSHPPGLAASAGSIDHSSRPTRPASTGSTHLQESNPIEWPSNGSSKVNGNSNYHTSFYAGNGKVKTNATMTSINHTQYGQPGVHSHDRSHKALRMNSLDGTSTRALPATDGDDEELLRLNSHHLMTHEITNSNSLPHVPASLNSPFPSSFSTTGHPGSHPDDSNWYEGGSHRPFTSSSFSNGIIKSKGGHMLHRQYSNPVNSTTGYLRQYSSSSPPSPTPGSSSSRVSAEFNEWYQALRIHSLYDFNRVPHGRITGASIDCGYNRGGGSGDLIGGTRERAAFSVPASVIGSLDDWIRVKPITVLQLDPADRAVLKIAGKCLSLFVSCQYPCVNTSSDCLGVFNFKLLVRMACVMSHKTSRFINVLQLPV